MTITRPLIPKEHGAWAILFIPMFTVALVLDAMRIEFLFLTLSTLFYFLCYLPAQTMLRHYLLQKQPADKLQPATLWFFVYFSIGSFFAFLILKNGFEYLWIIGGINLCCFLAQFVLERTFQKSLASDLISTAGLTTTSIAAYYVITSAIDGDAIRLYILNFLFFGSNVLYVYTKIRATSLKQERLSMTDKFTIVRLLIIYHLLVIGIVVYFVSVYYTPLLTMLSFAPMTLHAIVGVIKLEKKVQFQRLGFLLLVQSILFSIILGTTFRSPS